MSELPPDPRWCARLREGAERAVRRAEEPAAPPRRVMDRVDFDPSYDPAAPVVCEMCGGEMHYTGACKLMCGNCGYRRDCSDP